MITSTANPKIKNLALLGKNAKERIEQGVFLAEGRKMFKEAPREWIKKVYVTEAYLEEEGTAEELNGLSFEVVSDHVMKAAANTQAPQGILLLLSIPKWEFGEVMCDPKAFCLFLENIQDPGNLGTMLRTAEAAGATAVIADKRTVDLYNPKAIQATMGSVYRLPFFVAEDFYEMLESRKKCGMKLYAAHLKGKVLYDEADYRGPCGFMIGNEGNGLTEEAARQADAYIKIPMEGKIESLNAAAAAAVLLYEVNRQRRR